LNRASSDGLPQAAVSWSWSIETVDRTLNLYNTASRRKEAFSAPDNRVEMYCCGPTVYNFAHIGNLRTYIFEDVLKRALLSAGFSVKHVVNITDVGHLTSDADEGEDKMEKGALREGRSVWEIAAAYTAKFMANIRDLNIAPPDLWPKATDHIPEMVAMIGTLIDKGYTYTTADGIYFDTSKFPAYCDFARMDPESLRAGARVDMGAKRSPTDFALWKFSPSGATRQMEWESPWGVGFPGWHIECSAMSLKYLRQPLDIHCGGMDHVRVHHTNEIAQAEAATGTPFVRFWLHGEFLTLDAGKMAKSGGGFITLDTVKERGVDPLAYRMFCYSAHYRSPLAFSWEGLEGAAQSLANMRKLTGVLATEPGAGSARVSEVLQPFYAALDDDLNMPKAMAALWDIARSKDIAPADRKAAIAIADRVTGLDLLKIQVNRGAECWDESHTIKLVMTPAGAAGIDAQVVFQKINQRRSARATKDWASADVVRKELAALKISVRDLPDGSTECTLT
jgi:cysteinyl-tRNA synthetase